MPVLRFMCLSIILICLGRLSARAQEPSPTSQDFLKFAREQASQMRRNDHPPNDAAGWEARRQFLRRQLAEVWGGFPAEPCPLEPRKLGELTRDGYRVEKLIFQTRPGIWMTANAYVPDREGQHEGKVPAILMVHGHWRGAKQDPVVQSRCLGAVKHGFLVLVVDALGAGERGLGKALGEYHGEMVGATLLPVGLPLSGLQVYENLRAVDYLRTRPEVDPERIGITGASGGGNQSMYAGAWDERLKAVVPVCSVGNYHVYLGAACCMCEVVPGALRFTDEWGVLGLTAPRGLMIVSATRDAVQFSVPEAQKSLAELSRVFALYGATDHLKHAIFDSGHDYNREMRQAMYGWMTRHLKGEGDGSPLEEPAFQTEDPETLRCFPGDSRPDDWVTIPKFAAAEGRKLLADRQRPATADAWPAHAAAQRQALSQVVLGGFPSLRRVEPSTTPTAEPTVRELAFEPEPGIHLTARVESTEASTNRLALVLDLDGSKSARERPLTNELRQAGWNLVTLDLRATGAHAVPGDRIGNAPDHNSAEWALWIGRPLLGQWMLDVRRTLDALPTAMPRRPERLLVVGYGPAGIVAVGAASLDERITDVASIGSLASYITDVPYRQQRLGILAPGFLEHVGDVGDLAALVAPRRLVVVGGVSGGGDVLSRAELDTAYAAARQAYDLLHAEGRLTLTESEQPARVLAALDESAAR